MVFSTGAFAQSEELEPGDSESYEIFLPDTIFPYYPEKVIHTELQGVIKGDIIDSFADPKGFLVQSYDPDEGLKWWILIWKDSIYLAFDPLAESQTWSFSSLQIDRANLDGKGNDELVLHWQNTLGHSGWQGGISEDWEGMLVWDPDDLVRLMDIVYYYRLDSWWTNYRDWDPLEDTAENQLGHFDEEDIIDSGGETECDSYTVTFSPGYVVMKRDDGCEMEDDGEVVQEEKKEETIVTYKLTASGLVQVVSEK